MVGDHHLGLVKAIRKVMLGAAYQRCRVHFLRNVFSVINKEAGEMAAATIRTIFAQPTAEAGRTQLDTVAGMLGTQFPKVKAMLMEAKDDLTAFAPLPERHWKKIQSTNPLERSTIRPSHLEQTASAKPQSTEPTCSFVVCSGRCTSRYRTPSDEAHHEGRNDPFTLR